MKKILLFSALLAVLSGCGLFDDNNQTINDNNQTITNDNKIEVADTSSDTEKNQINENPDKENKEPETPIVDPHADQKIPFVEGEIFEAGSDIKINFPFKVYTNASDAKNKINSKLTYDEGTYYIFKVVEGSINVSKNINHAGGWVDLEELKIDSSKLIISENTKEQQTTGEDKNNDSSSRGNYSNLSTKAKSWSWNYPDTSANVSNFGGIYRLNAPNTIYLTFDNGYEYKNNTSQILDILKEEGVKAAFFITSDFMRSQPNVVKRMISEGHNVSNHTESHLHQGLISSEQVANDIKSWENTYKNITGHNPTTSLMRPPAGSYNDVSLKVAQDLGYKTVFWAYAYADWDTNNQPNVQTSLQNLLANNKDGNILLLHAVSDTNVSLLREYIKQTRAQGFNFELLR